MADDISPLPSDQSDPRSMALLPAGAAEQSNGEWNLAALGQPSKMGPDPTVYLHALRRRWLIVCGVGLLISAIAGPAVWFGMGERYTATAYLRVEMAETPVAFQTGMSWISRDHFDIYKNTQQQYILNPFVLMSALRKPEVRSIPVIQKEQRDGSAVEWLAYWLKVGFPGRAEMMTVRLSLDNAKEAQTLVRAVVDSYMTEIVNKESDRKREQLSKLEKVCDNKEQDIRTKREILKTLGQDIGTMDARTLNTRQRIALEELTMFLRQQANAQFDMKRLQGELAAQKALLANVDNTEISALELDTLVRMDPVARQIGIELGWRKMEELYTRERVLPNVKSQYAGRFRSEVNMLQEQYDQRVEELREKARDKQRSEIETEILRLETLLAIVHEQLEAVAQDIAARRAEAEKFGELSVDIQMLLADLRQQELLAAQLASERDKLRVELGAPQRITQLGPVEEPLVPSNTILRVVLTLLVVAGGFACPALVITFIDTRAGRINTSDDVSKKLRLSVIGSVPRIPAHVIHRLASPSKRHRSWHLRLTESVDGIAARLLLDADLKQRRVIMVTSATGGEGKTTLATQLALSLARTGRRTVLVDFDLRRPSFDEVFGIPLAPGVSELLRGQNDAAELVHQSATENLSVVTAGQWDRQALASLSNGGAAPLFKQLREDFEFVVIDTSPILPVADARFVSQLVDTVVLSVFRDISQAPKIQAACEILSAFGVQSVDAVVTGLNEHSYGKHMGYESTVTA